MISYKNSKSIYLNIVVFLLLYIFFSLLFPSKYYPDIFYLRHDLSEFNGAFFYSPHNLVNNFSQLFFSKNILDFLKNFFYLINLFFIFVILIFNLLIGNFKNKNLIKQNKIFLLSLMFPTTLLSITSPSLEAIFSIIAIFIMSNLIQSHCSIRSIFFLIMLFIYAFFLDIGNSIIFIGFIFFSSILFFVKDKLQTSYYIIFILIFLLIISYAEITILTINEYLNFKKINIIFSNIKILGLNIYNFQEMNLRYLYCWSTLFGLVTHLKDIVYFNIITILMTFYFLFHEIKYNSYKLKLLYNNVFFRYITFLAILYPFLIIGVLPTHAFGKYYLFILPIFIKILYEIIGEKKLLCLIVPYSLIYLHHWL